MTAFGAWRPLTGLTIVDLTRMLPGATTTLLLADLGATVHKIEHPSGDEMRQLRPSVGGDSSVQHQYIDRGKRSVRVDLKTDAGRSAVQALVRDADAVIESFRPGVADRIGVGFDELQQIRPGLVYLSLTGYGQEGPRAQYAGHDLNFLGYAGLQSESVAPVQHADVAGGMLAAVAILAGVTEARATGRGTHIDLALADAALVFGGFQIAEQLGSTALQRPIETPLDGRYPCYNVYRTIDGGRLVVGAIEPKFWRSVTNRLHRPEWFERQLDADLIPEMGALIATETADHWRALLEAPDTCVNVVSDSQALLADEHIARRRAITLVETPIGALPQVAAPFRGRPGAGPSHRNDR